MSKLQYQDGLPQSSTLRGKTFVFLGKWITINPEYARTLCTINGGQLASGLTDPISYVVLGQRTARKGPTDASTMWGDAQVITERDFLNMLLSSPNEVLQHQAGTHTDRTTAGSSRYTEPDANVSEDKDDEDEEMDEDETDEEEDDHEEAEEDDRRAWAHVHHFIQNGGEIRLEDGYLRAGEGRHETYVEPWSRSRTAVDMLLDFGRTLQEENEW